MKKNYYITINILVLVCYGYFIGSIYNILQKDLETCKLLGFDTLGTYANAAWIFILITILYIFIYRVIKIIYKNEKN